MIDLDDIRGDATRKIYGRGDRGYVGHGAVIYRAI
jgi:hypothetical protein